MWLLDPTKMCRKHLLGEHVELHMLVGAINKKKSITGFLSNSLVEVHTIRARHEELLQEMNRRGYKHKSELPFFEEYEAGKVNKEENLKDLCNRCPECKKRFENL